MKSIRKAMRTTLPGVLMLGTLGYVWLPGNVGQAQANQKETRLGKDDSYTGLLPIAFSLESDQTCTGIDPGCDSHIQCDYVDANTCKQRHMLSYKICEPGTSDWENRLVPQGSKFDIDCSHTWEYNCSEAYNYRYLTYSGDADHPCWGNCTLVNRIPGSRTVNKARGCTTHDYAGGGGSGTAPAG
jgi:hypothetical protein